MSESHAVAYKALRGRVREVVEAADPAALDAIVPATPEWRARDVLAHLVGVSDDVVNGRLEGIASNAWTQVQVEARRHRPVGELLVEWDESAPKFESMLAAAPPEIAGQALFDAATHEHDLRNALGSPGARDSDAVLLRHEPAEALRVLDDRDASLHGRLHLLGAGHADVGEPHRCNGHSSMPEPSSRRSLDDGSGRRSVRIGVGRRLPPLPAA